MKPKPAKNKSATELLCCGGDLAASNRHPTRRSTGRNIVLFFVLAPLPFFLYLVLTMHFGIMVELDTFRSLGMLPSHRKGGISAIAWDIDEAPSLRRTADTTNRRSLNIPSGDLPVLFQKDNTRAKAQAKFPAETAVSNDEKESASPASPQDQFKIKTQSAPVEKTVSKIKKALATPSRIPNVLLAGVQKSGTTAIASWIFHLNNVCKPASVKNGEPIKEAHFFNNDDRFADGIEMYEKHFKHCTSDETIWLDATPNYFPQADRVRKIYDAAGGTYAQDLKIIFVLREPVERDFSWYNHMVADSNDPKTKKYARNVLDEKGKLISFDRYVKNTVLVGWEGVKTSFGRYAKWIQRWMDHFDRQQILVLNYNELLNDPKSVTKRLRIFLDLAEDDGPDGIVYHNKKANAKKLLAPSCKAQENLAKEYEQENQKLYELLEANPGPESEQRPFAKFKLSECVKGPALKGTKAKTEVADQAASVKRE